MDAPITPRAIVLGSGLAETAVPKLKLRFKSEAVLMDAGVDGETTPVIFARAEIPQGSPAACAAAKLRIVPPSLFQAAIAIVACVPRALTMSFCPPCVYPAPAAIVLKFNGVPTGNKAAIG